MPRLGVENGTSPSPTTTTCTAAPTSPKRLKNRLHNFVLPPLKWATQRRHAGDKRKEEPKERMLTSPIHDLGLEEMREKLIQDLRNSVDKMKDAILRNNEEEKEEPRESPPPPAVRPWYLRSREAPVKFSLSLSKEEIEEDFMKMVGHLPPRKPNKRPKAVQKDLDVSLYIYIYDYVILIF